VVIAVYLGRDIDVTLASSTGILSWRMVGAAFAIASLLGVVAGWIPALIASQRDPAQILKEA
jgi:ABC-type antimicrobial peptide transport system permease subunit